jgi:hypothetical protein
LLILAQPVASIKEITDALERQRRAEGFRFRRGVSSFPVDDAGEIEFVVDQDVISFVISMAEIEFLPSSTTGGVGFISNGTKSSRKR